MASYRALDTARDYLGVGDGDSDEQAIEWAKGMYGDQLGFVEKALSDDADPHGSDDDWETVETA